MEKVFRWYNQNRWFFWIFVTFIAFIIIIIQTLNGIAKEEKEQKKKEIANVNSSTNESTTISETDKSVITNERVPKAEDEKNTKTIKEFVEYCNNKETEKAYDMLSPECKESVYPTHDVFVNNYYKRIFYINRMYNLENWYNDSTSCTYYIKYTEDVLATGNTNSNDNRADYITVIKQDGKNYLNINSYVKRKISNKITTQNDITVKINWTDMYVDYSILNFSIINDTKKVICIDTKENINTMYLYDKNGVKYTSFLNEIAIEQLVIYRNMERKLKVKFNKMYNPERTIIGMTASDIVLNYEEYKEKSIGKETIKIDAKI